jgi:hypothetical protein
MENLTSIAIFFMHFSQKTFLFTTEILFPVSLFCSIEDLCYISTTCLSGNHKILEVLLITYRDIFNLRVQDNPRLPESREELYKIIQSSKTPLYPSEVDRLFLHACTFGFQEYISKRILKEADCNFRHSLTPVRLSVLNGHSEVLRCLLGAGFEFRDYSRNRSPLLTEALDECIPLSSKIASVKVLLDQHVAELIKLIPDAANSKRIRIIVSTILSSICHAITRFRSPEDMLVLGAMTVSLSKHKEVTYLLHIYSKHLGGEPPLIVATLYDRPRVVNLLLSLQISLPSDISRKGLKTALYVAVESGHAECVSILLKRGASVSALTASGRNCLHAAVERNEAEVLDTLCVHANACDVLQANSSEISPLVLAEKRGSMRMSLSLLRCFRRTWRGKVTDPLVSSLLFKYKKYLS